jgi:hypothetical protein
MSTSTIHPSIPNLLRFTETHQRHRAALARATGEHFNIFQVLRVGHLEVKTHSPILAELLSPKGRHGQGELFLNLFLKRFDVGDFDAKTATAIPEYHVGQVTEDSGGRIDIVIRDGRGTKILIENKIYAGDQPNQMTRYSNFDPKARLFYLTLFGGEPNNVSGEELKRIRCECISYAENILPWLMDCRKESACLPGVREMISQYIGLIEELTYQSTNLQMNQELIEEILRTPESLKAFYTLRDAEWTVHTELIARLDADLDDYSKVVGLEKDGPLRELNTKYGSFGFKSKDLSRNNLVISFHFESGGYNDMCFGFAKINPDLPCPVAERLLVAFAENFPSGTPTLWWPAWSYFEEPYKYWRQEAFEGIRSGQFAGNVKAKLRILSLIAKGVCGDSQPSESKN